MNKTKNDPVKGDLKTAPKGEAPDKAHAAGELSPGRRNVEREENFNSSPHNAQSRQTTERLK
jgi:hypothetical protein